MEYKSVFKRYELKYVISKTQQEIIMKEMLKYTAGDKYGRSTVCNIYFDTPDYLLIRRSIEKPIYKEKLRLRSYGIAAPESTVFAELKKKYNSIVYKRRMALPETDAMKFLCREISYNNTQISREIHYFLSVNQTLMPAVFLSYNREAFFAENNSAFRITFDSNILWRNYDLSLCSGIYGKPILPESTVLMELKTSDAIPLWMTALLSENRIYKTSFSKYGSAYKSIWLSENKGEKHYA